MTRYSIRKDKLINHIFVICCICSLALSGCGETEDNYIAELAAHEELVQEILKCQTHEDKMAFVQKQIEQHRNDDKYINGII